MCVHIVSFAVFGRNLDHIVLYKCCTLKRVFVVPTQETQKLEITQKRAVKLQGRVTI